jgi:hypothetical protein
MSSSIRDFFRKFNISQHRDHFGKEEISGKENTLTKRRMRIFQEFPQSIKTKNASQHLGNQRSYRSPFLASRTSQYRTV